MKKAQFLWTTLLGLALVGLIAGPGMNVGAMQTKNPTPTTGGPWPGMMGGQGAMWPGMMGPGMPGGQGMWPGMMGPGMTGPGMMGGMMGPGMMGGQGMMGPGIMGGMMGIYPATVTPIGEEDAKQRLATFVAALGPDVKVAEVMPFAANYYAQLVDASGAGVGEVLVDRYTGAVYPEPGPNMMWNTRWGMMAGIGATTQYDEAAAQVLAEGFLAGYLPGAGILESTAFPGYYTFDFGRGEVEGMLSVNAVTGEVWVHTWHGPGLTGEVDAAPSS